MRAAARSVNNDWGWGTVVQISLFKPEGFDAYTSAVNFFCYDLFHEMNHSTSTTFTEVSVLPRWWSWKCRGWSLWLRTGLSTAPWRWREARNSKPTKQKHPSQRKDLSVCVRMHECVHACAHTHAHTHALILMHSYSYSCTHTFIFRIFIWV